MKRAAGSEVNKPIEAPRPLAGHLLNPVSPAFTSSMALARTVATEHFH